MLDYSEYIKGLIALVAIVNPLGVIPLFIGMTAGQSPRELRHTANLVPIGVAVILLVSLVCGELILQFFGITIDSFRVGGGILILLMALSMLHAKTSPVRQTDEEASESIEKDSVAIVPLAMPLLAGPGAISSVILAAHRSSSVVHHAMVGLTIIALSLMIWAALRLAPWLAGRIGATGINIFTRIMGLILTAIAVEFIVNGIKGLFPGLE